MRKSRIMLVLIFIFSFTVTSCTTVQLTTHEKDSIRSAVAKVLPRGANISVHTQGRFLSKPDLVISAHLLEGHSADESSPYVRGDYGTHERLTRLVRYRSAKVIKSILAEGTLPDVGGIVVNTRHGVRQSYIGQPSSSSDVAMTLYTVRYPVQSPNIMQSSNSSEKEIMEMFIVMRNVIPTLTFSTVSY